MAKTSAVGDVAGPESFQHDVNFQGPAKRRSCTDVLCLLIFLAFLVGWMVVGAFAWRFGNPDSLVYPTDSYGKMCGKDPEVANKPVLFFFDLTKCANPAVLVTGCPTPQVCIEKCPTENYLFTDPSNADRNKLICINGINPQTATVAEIEQHCAKYYLKSVNVGGRCLPGISVAEVDEIFDQIGISGQLLEGAMHLLGRLEQLREIGQRVFEDLRASWWAILVGLAVGAVVAFIWIVLMQFIASIMVWISMIAVLGLFSYGLYFSVRKYIDLKEHPGSSASLADVGFTVDLDIYLHLRDTWLGFSIVIGIILLVLILIFLFLRDRILIAIELIREGSKAVSAVTSTLFYPAFTFLLQIGCFAVFVSMAIYLASIGTTSFRVVGLDRDFDSGVGKECTPGCFGYKTNDSCVPKHFKECSCTASDLEPRCIFFSYQDEYGLAKLQVYNIFAFLWTTFFVSAFGELVLAGAFSAWYWTFDKKRGAPSLALLSSFGRGLRYHIGTVAFGSFIIAVIRGIRLVLEYLDRKLKEFKDNPVAKCVMCCCKCFFWCLEKFMRFVNRNAYIVCAVHGKAFCPSAQTAFFLLLRNVARVVILDKVTDFLLFIGKLVVVGAVGIASFYVFSGQVPVEFIKGRVPETHYYHVPVILVTIGTYFVACAFFSVYEMAVDTLFIGFLEDSERNDGSPEKPYFMSKSLMKILGKKNRRYEDTK